MLLWKRRVDKVRQRYHYGKRGKFGKKLKFPKVTHTMYIQNPVSGLMEGREGVRGVGDRTGIIRERSLSRVVGRTPAP